LRPTRKKAPRECWTRPRGKARLGWGQELTALNTKNASPHHLFNKIAVMSSGAPPIRPNEKSGLRASLAIYDPTPRRGRGSGSACSTE
jgi:hypothetical protein